MSLRLTIVLFLATCLAGCAHGCRPQTFFKATKTDGGRPGLAGSNADLLLYSIQGVVIRISECGWANRRLDGGPVSVCVRLHLNEGRTLKLSSKTFLLVRADGTSLGTARLRERSGHPQNYPYADDEPITFVGGKGNGGSAFSRAVSEMETWRRYDLAVDLPELHVAAFLFQLPDVSVSDIPIPLRRVRFERVTESVCFGPG
ncbi:MAG: hypothetical protein JWN13_3294 [Betaproteobacteria bacterium]|nr:hypothetical protein [Betaproteobacteria bacterium]